MAPLSVSPFSVCAATPDKAWRLFDGLVPLYDARPLKLSCTLQELQPTPPVRPPPGPHCQVQR